MDLSKIKEQHAKEMGYDNWTNCINDQPSYMVEIIMDEICLKLKISYELAKKCIDESPCDPDITSDQIEAHKNLKDLLNKIHGEL